MKLYLKETCYFEVSIPDGNSNEHVTTVFKRDVEPLWEALLEKVRFSKQEQNHLNEIFGDINIRILSEKQFLRIANSHSEKLQGEP